MRSFPLLVVLALLPAACKKDIDVGVNDGNTPATGVSLPECADGAGPGLHGPAMLHVGRLDGNCAWIDATEVTRAQYGEFLDAIGVAGGGTDGFNAEECEGRNDDFAPSASVDMTASDHPVAGIDWCDAAAFCAWAGKTLCGTYDLNGASTSYFQTVCTHGTDGVFRADQEFALASDHCNGDSSATVPVASKPACMTPADVADLVGNVKEWTAECDGAAASAQCRYRGGSYKSKSGSADSWGCEQKVAAPRTHRADDLGFRCCAEE